MNVPRFAGSPADAAGRLLAVVEEGWNEGFRPARNDHATRDVLIGYGRAFNQLEGVLREAGAGDVEATSVLARALISTAVRTLWLAEAPDDFEREHRRRSQNRAYYAEKQKMLDHLEQIGALDADGRSTRDEIGRAQSANGAWFTRATAQAGSPVEPWKLTEADVAKRVGMDIAYAMVYRPASDEMHAGTGSLVGRIALHEEGGRVERVDVPLRHVDHDQCEQLVGQSVLIYADLVERTAGDMGHGIDRAAINAAIFEP